MTNRVDNLIKTINDYVKDMYNTFGGESNEYMNAVEQMRRALPENVVEQYVKNMSYRGGKPEKPAQIKRSKDLQYFREDLEELRKRQRMAGTAKVKQQKYIEKGKKTTRQQIKQRAYERYKYDISDMYMVIMDADDDKISPIEKKAVQTIYRNNDVKINEQYIRDLYERALRNENVMAQAVQPPDDYAQPIDEKEIEDLL